MGEDTARREFERLITQLAHAAGPDEARGIDEAIWDRFGTTGTSFISDMASFTQSSRTFGVTHFLKLIHRTRETVAPIVADHGGCFLKSDADNCYAFFPKPDQAVQASLDINAELFRANQSRRPEEQIFLSVGIDRGKLLLIGSEDFFGDPVNTASKLGEDLAGRGETLVTERAIAESNYTVPETAEHLVARISEVEIRYLKLPMTEPG